MILSSRQSQRGFSLVEMLVYIGILVFMLAIVIEVVLSIGGSDKIIRAHRNIDTSATLALDRIGREARGADSIVVASSVLGSNPGRLVLMTQNGSGTPRTVEFYVSGGQLILRENGVDTGALTASDATVSNLVFRRFASSTVEGIRTEMSLTSGTTSNFMSETFYSSVLLR